MPLKPVNYNERLKKTLVENPEYKKFVFDLRAEREMKIKLIEIRKEQKLTQKDIAKRAGITQQMVSRIETVNSPTPNLDTFIKYINALGFKLELTNA